MLDGMKPIPLRPDPGALVSRNVTALARAAITKAMVPLDPRCDERQYLRTRWPDDSTAPLILRAASQPTTLAANPALGHTFVPDLIATIGPTGAGARLLQAGLQLVFDSAGQVYVPAIEARADKVAFVPEGEPIPVQGLTATGALLEPRKLAVIVVLTGEMIAGSNAEVLVTDALTRSVGLAIDAALFDAAAGDSSRPAGLRFGVVALPASSATDFVEAMIADVAALAGAVAGVAGGGPIFLATSPVRAVKLRLRAPRELPFDLLAASAIADDEIIAIAPNALVSAVDAVPKIDSSTKATVVMRDDPAELGTVGVPNVAAAPAISLFQSDSVGLRVLLQVDWSLRASGAIAWIDGATW
jgi:hypothetical protein